MNPDGALTPAVGDRRSSSRRRARPRREGLPRPALPDGDGEIAGRVRAHELDVRPFGEALVPLDERAEPQELAPLRLAPEDRMRVPDRDGSELEPLAVDHERLGPTHLGGT